MSLKHGNRLYTIYVVGFWMVLVAFVWWIATPPWQAEMTECFFSGHQRCESVPNGIKFKYVKNLCEKYNYYDSKTKLAHELMPTYIFEKNYTFDVIRDAYKNKLLGDFPKNCENIDYMKVVENELDFK